MKKSTKYFTVADLQARFGIKDAETVYAWIANYKDVLKPLKIGGKFLFHPKNIKNFENNMRVN